MNTTPLVHLAWKEYRFARGFWLAMIALVVAAQALVVWWSRFEQFSDTSIALIVCNLALGAPVFFALGCAGATFAVEREEGTYDFLRAAPLSAAQVFGTKLALTTTATVAMFALLWLVAMWFTRGALPAGPDYRGMLGLWLLAAVEAIAWGTLFSLLTARPLVAVGLALVTTSTLTHLLAWNMAEGPGYEFRLAHYLDAALWHVAILVPVLAVDVYLGLRWLDEANPRPLRKQKPATLLNRQASIADERRAARSLAASPERGVMFTRLLWQNWRQSAWLMGLLAGLQVALTLLVKHAGFEDSDELAIVPLAALAAVMGSAVFLADQERRQFRFFVEHNVPPRTVWLARVLPWLLVLGISTLVTTILWAGPSRANLWVMSLLCLARPPYGMVLAWVAVAFAAGQWTSMLVRSGLMAGFLGLLLAGVLCGWVLLMFLLQVSWFWSVAPIVFVLLWATWLRAPDWVREKATWTARGKAAAVVLVPAYALCLIVPYYRVHQIAVVSPGFDPAVYRAEVDAMAQEGRATANLYRQAGELYPASDNTNRQTAFDDEVLPLLLKASGQSHCLLDDPRRAGDVPELRHADGLISGVVASARRLQHEGKLDDALDRYFAAVTMVSQWTEQNGTGPWTWNDGATDLIDAVLHELPGWAAEKDQSVERIRGAIERLQKLDDGVLHLEDRLKAANLLAHRFTSGDPSVEPRLFPYRYGHPYLTGQKILLGALLPWERHRELRAIDQATRDSLRRLSDFAARLDAGEGVIDLMPYPQDGWYRWNPGALFQSSSYLSYIGREAVSQLAQFEARRRATILLLALEAYRLEHGDLPPTLDALVGTFLDKLPHDPYSGDNYRYFREGLPMPATEDESLELRVAQGEQNIQPGVPCIWSTSPAIAVRREGHVINADEVEKPLTYYAKRVRPQDRLPRYEAWALGNWYPIPKEQAKTP